MATFDALYLARGWLSVAVASADDSAHPQLHRTVSIEKFTDGLRLVATDSYILLRSWVPSIGKEDNPEPDLDEAPIATAIAIDEHRRAQGFLAHLLKLATVEGADVIEVDVGLGVVDVGEGSALSFEGLESRWVTIDQRGRERLRLGVYDGEYPHWRGLLPAGQLRQRTDAIALHPDRLAQLAKLAKVQPGRAIRCRFTGHDGLVLIEVDAGEPAVTGGVMPVRVLWENEIAGAA
jgi:hypothetical protein